MFLFGQLIGFGAGGSRSPAFLSSTTNDNATNVSSDSFSHTAEGNLLLAIFRIENVDSTAYGPDTTTGETFTSSAGTAANAFDDDTGTACDPNSGSGSGGWVGVQFSADRVIVRYRVYISTGASEGEKITSFILKASATGDFAGEETTIDTWSTGVLSTGWQARNVTNTTAYTYYRLYMTCSSGTPDIFEVEMLEHPGVQSATYNSVAMTKAVYARYNDMACEIWYLVNPTAGSNTLAYTFRHANDLYSAVAINISGANSSDPIGNTAVQEDNYGFGQVVVSKSITPAKANSLLVGGLQADDGTADPFAPFAGITEIDDGDITDTTNMAYWSGYMPTSTVKSYSFGATATNNPDDVAMAIVEVKSG